MATDKAGQGLLVFMGGVYPLVVVPWGGDYFYLPRYVLLALTALAGLLLLSRTISAADVRKYAALVIFLVMVGVSTCLSPDPMNSWMGEWRCTGLSTYIFCGVLLVLASRCSQPRTIIEIMVIGGMLVSGLAWLQWLGVNLVPDDGVRAEMITYSTLANRNFLGSYTVFLLPAAIFLYLQQARLIWMLASAMLFGALLVSLTRGAWLAGLGMGILICLYVGRTRAYRSRWARLMLVLLLVLVVLAPTRDGLLVKRWFSVPSEVKAAGRFQDEAGAGRIQIWKECMRLVPDGWAWGMGPENLGRAGIVCHGQAVDKAHNIYLELLVTCGVFALAAFLGLIGAALKKPASLEDLLIAAMLAAYLLQGFFNIDVVMVMPLFWIVLGFSLGRKWEARKRFPQSRQMPERETGPA